MTQHLETDFPTYSPEEAAAVAALSGEDVAAIDRALVARTQGEWQKVALVVVGAMYAYPDAYEDIPDHFYGRRVQALVAAGRLEVRGTVAAMRASEVRLADSYAGA